MECSISYKYGTADVNEELDIGIGVIPENTDECCYRSVLLQ